MKHAKQREAAQIHQTEQDLFRYLPSEIILNILSRLPARTVMSCKCVCKPWLDLLTTPEFVKSHLSKSVPGLAVFERETLPFKIIEFVDEVDRNCNEHHWNVVFNLDLPFHERVHNSVNGLLFLCAGRFCHGGDCLLCNPITRDYIMFPSRQQYSPEPVTPIEKIYGFGVSRLTGQYKLVGMFIHRRLPSPMPRDLLFECQVYTVGTGSWRRIALCSPPEYEFYNDRIGVFSNGNLHWLAYKGFSVQITCFDLETERFSTFSPPPRDDPNKYRKFSVLGDCLCVCYYLENDEFIFDCEIDIWLMKEYGDEKSWTKEFTIHHVDTVRSIGFPRPIKVFKDGGILMESGSKLLYYSSTTKTIQEVDPSGFQNYFCTAIYTPSFLSLKSFAMENVSSF